MESRKRPPSISSSLCLPEWVNWFAIIQQLSIIAYKKSDMLPANFSYDSKHILTVSQDGTARVWDITSQNFIELKGHKSGINYGMFHPQNNYLVVTASSDQTVRLWDMRDPEYPIILSGHRGSVSSSVFNSMNPFQVLTASEDGTAMIYTVESWEQVVKNTWRRATRCMSEAEKRTYLLHPNEPVPQQSLYRKFPRLPSPRLLPHCNRPVGKQ